MSQLGPKIYTKTGDQGETSLIGGKRVSKADLRLDSYGSVDELNSVVGILRAQIAAAGLTSRKIKNLDLAARLLEDIQNTLFDVGSHLACEKADILAKLPQVDTRGIEEMEHWIDAVTPKLAPLKNFILPGGSLSAAHAHLARTMARRCERIVVHLAQKEKVEDVIIQYLNRLSDFLFVVARYLNHLENISDVIWSAKTRS